MPFVWDALLTMRHLIRIGKMHGAGRLRIRGSGYGGGSTGCNKASKKADRPLFWLVRGLTIAEADAAEVRTGLAAETVNRREKAVYNSRAQR